VAATAPVQKWGVFNADGSVAIVADSVVAVEYDKEYSIATYPVEGGGFESYNKIERPYSAHIVLTQGGTDADRGAFLATVDTALGALTLYSIVTPTVSYANANLVRENYRRAADRGAQLITVELLFEEVRVSATQAFSTVKSPTDASRVDGGAVQASTPTPTQAAATTGQGS
jgi:hypothetical protein